MLQKQDLVENFEGVVEIGAGVYRCQDVTPKSTYYYYLKLADAEDNDDLLMVSENKQDNEFALFVFNNIDFGNMDSYPVVVELPPNKNNFTSLYMADYSFHAYFKGILDNKRTKLVLCLPIYRCEFSGDESAEDFILMRRETVSSLDWERAVSPKTILRFDNPVTKSGTGDNEVLVKYQVMLNEIDNLNGVSKGFVELINYQGLVVEILSPELDKFTLIRDRDDSNRESLDKEVLLNKILAFFHGTE